VAFRDETIQNWSRDSSRAALGRTFEHSVMRRASARVADPQVFPFKGENPAVVAGLTSVAKNLVRLQDNRHIADYDNSQVWTHVEALAEVRIAVDAFSTWRQIRNEKIAQDYLVSLLIKPRN
jgi:hypothetical protein